MNKNERKFFKFNKILGLGILNVSAANQTSILSTTGNTAAQIPQ